MYEDMTQEFLINEMLADIDLPLHKGEGSALYNTLAPAATQMAKMYTLFDNILQFAFLTNNKHEFLDERMDDFARYRKTGEKATGIVYIKGNKGAIINNGDVIGFNGLNYVIVQDITLDSEIDNNAVAVQAIDVGAKYNVPAGINFNYLTGDSAGYVKLITNKVPFKNGIDIESDIELYQRHIWEMKNNPTSGNEAHYIKWAKEIPGVVSAKSNPEWNGNGNVRVLIMGASGEPVQANTLQAVKDYIQTKRPVGANVIVNTSKAKKIEITGKIKLAKGFNSEDLIEDLTEEINNYFTEITDEKIIYVKVMAIIAKQFGVYDVSDLLINNNTNNIKLDSEEVPYVDLSKVIL